MKESTWELKDPKVKTVMLHGSGVKTPVGFKYRKDNDWDSSPVTIDGDGDGTVPLRSLLAGKNWDGV